MSGETNLEKLLTSMAPELRDGEYVFCTFPNARYGDYQDLEPVAAINESEETNKTIVTRWPSKEFH
jgi:hypothetical protein